MTKIYLINIVILLSSHLLIAQSVSPQVIAPAGGYSASSDIQVSWTLGETFIAPLGTNNSLSLSQGFQQNTSICVSIVDYQYVKAGNPYQGLFPLTNNMVINQIPDQVTIMVTDVCSNVSIESFEMNIQGPELNWNIVQNVPPNTLFDNLGNSFNGRNFIPGNYTLTVTGYAQDNKGGGVTYGPVVTQFTVVGNLATISMPTLSSANLCAGSNVDVSFSTTGTFNPDNLFYVQLSHPGGSFEFPTVIGTSANSGTVVCTIPTTVIESSNYLIRVVSSNQVYAGNPTMSMLEVNPNTKYLSSPLDDLSTGSKNQKVSNTIVASNKLAASTIVNYQAGNAVVLDAGFEVKAGGVFKAHIAACN